MRAKIQQILSPMDAYNAYVAKQQLTPEQREVNGFRLIEPSQAHKIGMQEWMGSAMFIPYHLPNGTPSGKYRARLFYSRNPKQKYWQPSKRSGESGDYGAFLPQGVCDWEVVFADPSQPLWITEGEVKAVKACEYMPGQPVLAIGGVTMRETLLERTTVEWNGRDVIVCFDHDEGQAPGEYNPMVTSALGKLCEGLASKGARVQVCSLGKAAVAQGLVGKVGLDDYFRQGGAVEALFSYLEPPPKGCEILAEMFSRYVSVTLSKPSIWDAWTGNVYPHTHFLEATRNKWVDVETKNGFKRVRKGLEFLERPDIPTATRFVIDPSKDSGYLPDDGVINTWVPFKTFDGVEVRADYKAAFGRLVETMAGEFPKEVSQWLAHYVRRPWERTSQAVLIATNLNGVGKSLLGEIVGHLVGHANYAETSLDNVLNRFNANLETKTWILINELSAKFAVKEGVLKDLIAREHNRVEHKSGAIYDVTNLRRYMMNSNEASAMRLDSENRRVWVCYPALDEESAVAWKEWLVENVTGPYDHGAGDSFLASAKEWLEEIDLTGYDPMAPVINGDAARELIEDSMSATEHAAHWLVREFLESGEEALVYTAVLHKEYKTVFTLAEKLLKAKGYGRGRYGVQLTKGTEWVLVVAKTSKNNYCVNSSGNRTYCGNLPPETLRKLQKMAETWVLSAVSHLKQ